MDKVGLTWAIFYIASGLGTLGYSLIWGSAPWIAELSNGAFG